MENSSDDMDSYDVDDYIFGGDPDDSDAETVVDGSSAETHNSNEDDDFVKIVNYVITHDLAILQDMLKKKYKTNPKYDINKLFKGNTLLMLAVKFNHTAVIKYLLTIKNINVNIKDEEMDLTPLMVAVMNNKTNIVKMLVEKGADIINYKAGSENEIDIRSLSTKANSNIYKILDEKQIETNVGKAKVESKVDAKDESKVDATDEPKDEWEKMTKDDGSVYWYNHSRDEILFEDPNKPKSGK